jgi:16S rRNA (guanine527-N7)-methyltransferase
MVKGKGLHSTRGMDEILMHTLAEGAAAIGVHLGPAERALFAVYHRELLLWNQRINLISENSSQEIVNRHFLDSLTSAPFLDHPAGALIDIGTGGGFPGIPLRIALPNLQVTLVEASRKKSSFLSHIVRTLQLDGVHVAHERVELLTSGKTLAGCFDTLISRAAFKLPELIRLASFFLKPGGQLIAMKGQKLDDELADAERILDRSGMVFTALRDVRPPRANSSRIIVTYNRSFS